MLTTRLPDPGEIKPVTFGEDEPIASPVLGDVKLRRWDEAPIRWKAPPFGALKPVRAPVRSERLEAPRQFDHFQVVIVPPNDGTT